MKLFSHAASKKRGRTAATQQRMAALQQFRRDLPVAAFRKQLLHVLDENRTTNKTTLVVAETGSGKSTQIPAYFMESTSTSARPLRIAVTQPRRVAAMYVNESTSRQTVDGTT